MEIPILGQGPKITPVEQFSALLDTLCETLGAAKVAAEKTLPGSELAKALSRADALKAEISPVLAGVLAQVKEAERKRNREKAVEVIQREADIMRMEPDAGHWIREKAQVVDEVADKVSAALGGEPVTPAARA